MKIYLRRHHALMVKDGAFSQNTYIFLENSKSQRLWLLLSQYWLKLWQFCWMGGFCLLVSCIEKGLRLQPVQQDCWIFREKIYPLVNILILQDNGTYKTDWLFMDMCSVSQLNFFFLISFLKFDSVPPLVTEHTSNNSTIRQSQPNFEIFIIVTSESIMQ